MTTTKYITVFIPTYNGEKYLAECIEAIIHQKLPEDYKLELLITDSGSRDGTLDILRTYANAGHLVFDEIPNSEFSHGGTRARAAERAKGDYILFLSQDATPSHYRWIINMVEPFFISEKVGCVFGRQVPRPHSVPTIKREVAGVFGGLGAPDALILHREKSLVDGEAVNPLNSFFSDVNSAIRKGLVSIVPFRHVSYAEDQALAQDMQNAGYIKAYAPQGSVWHSNEYTAKEYYHRKFDEYIGLQESVSDKFVASKRSLLLGWIRPTIADWKFTVHDHEYPQYAKLKFIIMSPAYNFYMQLGKYNAIKYINSPEHREKVSLEAKRKAKD
jgi:rhamnosyltransferase